MLQLWVGIIIKEVLPEGSLSDDQMSWAPHSGVIGGQLITGNVVFPDTVGPRPLLLPAMATKTTGSSLPGEKDEIV